MWAVRVLHVDCRVSRFPLQHLLPETVHDGSSMSIYRLDVQVLDLVSIKLPSILATIG